jgi:hypothetical protein
MGGRMVCQRVVMASTAAGEVAGSRSTLVWMCSVNAGLIHTCIKLTAVFLDKGKFVS